MIGDRDVRVAELARRLDHLGQRRLAVTGVGVHLQIATDLLERHELRQLVRFREGDFTAVFAHLRRNPVEAERGVDILLRPSGNAFRSAEYAVLVQLEFLGLRDLAQLDVVRLRSREVLHRGAETRRFDDAQIDLQSAGKPDGGARVALRGDLPDLAEFPQALDDRGGLGGGTGDHNVEVADRFLAPPETAGHVDLIDRAPPAG